MYSIGTKHFLDKRDQMIHNFFHVDPPQNAKKKLDKPKYNIFKENKGRMCSDLFVS